MPKLTLEDAKTLAQLRTVLKIGDDDWDAILWTDGSGTTWKLPCGWAGTLFLRSGINAIPVCGAANWGSNNFAEAMAVFYAVSFITEAIDYVQEHGFNVHVITDSQYVANGLADHDPPGHTEWASETGANRPVWLGINGCRRKGINLIPHHLPRATTEPNKMCDKLANITRRAMQSVLEGARWQDFVDKMAY